MPLPRAILFDWDDTLVRTRECRFNAIRELAARHYNLEISEKEIEAHWGVPFNDLFSDLFGSVDSDTSRVTERYLALTDEFPMTPHLDAAVVVDKLCDRHLVGIVTSASERVVLPDLRRLHFPLQKIFCVQCAEATNFHKPDPRVFMPILNALCEQGIEACEALYVGDHPNDFVAARSAGMHFVGISHGPHSEERFKACGAASVGHLWHVVGYSI